jgi:NADH-quinone oxidoreductase subunit D
MDKTMQTKNQAEKFTIPIGPQHPALKEPEHFLFTVEGEIITDAVVRLGYAHRGIEKATESRTWVQNLYLVERVCGICSHIHATAYCLGVEKLAEVEAPPRAQAIRVVVAELERIHSHMLWLGVAAHEAGFDTLFMYSWRDREIIMDILEELTGNRVNYSVNVLGGVKYDIDDRQADVLLRGIDDLEKRTRHYLDVVTKDALLLQRTRGVGVMTKLQAEVLGAVGPTARASGLERDIRVEAPYSAYLDYPIQIVLDQKGDLEARFAVRVKELLESYHLIRMIVDTLPDGELTTRLPRKIKEGEATSRVEAPRGELFYFLKSDGEDVPARIRIRTPTICNMTSVVKLVVGHQLADVPMILAGIDPCFSCNDRMVRISDGRSQKNTQTWTWESLRQYGIEYYDGIRK